MESDSVNPPIQTAFSNLVIGDGLSKKINKRKKLYIGRLRKSGFDKDLLEGRYRLRMNKEEFQKIADEQLRSIRIDPDHRFPLMESFLNEELGLNHRVLENLRKQEITEPTPVQKVAIPYFLETQNDLIIGAQTGSGKTHTFLLPIVSDIARLTQNSCPNKRRPYAIIVAPTRELVQQLADDADLLAYQAGEFGVAVGYGELDMRDSRASLEKGCDILVVTLGRLYHYALGGADGRETLIELDNLKYLVIDEVDAVLKNHYSSIGEHTPEEVIRGVINQLDRNRVAHRRIMLSATIDKRNRLIKEFMRNPINIKVGNEHPVHTVKQTFLNISDKSVKNNVLMNHLAMLSKRNPATGRPEIGKTLIFTNSIIDSDRLAYTLKCAGYLANSLNSERSQRQRYMMINEFKKNIIEVIVATDVLARGLNIPRVDNVINYDMPRGDRDSASTYIHRVGRCGRIGNYGIALSFFDPNCDHVVADEIIEACRGGNQQIPQFILDCGSRGGYRPPSSFHETETDCAFGYRRY